LNLIAFHIALARTEYSVLRALHVDDDTSVGALDVLDGQFTTTQSTNSYTPQVRD